MHPDHDGVVRDVIVRYALLKPGPEPYIAGFNKKGPFKTKLVAVQNLAMMYSRVEQKEDMEKFCMVKSGGSTMVDWVANTGESRDEKHEHADGARDALTCTDDVATLEEVLDAARVPAKDKTVLETEERRPAAASHFNGHLKVKVDEIQDDIGPAPHSTRNSGSQEDDQHQHQRQTREA